MGESDITFTLGWLPLRMIHPHDAEVFSAGCRPDFSTT